jgi:glyoxylase-like metal-dependent hydrolase (beta-lactamase superfamily II)
MTGIRLKSQMRYSSYPNNEGEFVIHMLTSTEHTFCTNAYIIETQNALVVVDTMMINSDATLLRQRLDDIGKPLIAIIITHGHPDHYNGNSIIISGFGDIPIISTQGVRDCIKSTVDTKQAKWGPYFGKEWPDTKLLPNMLVKDAEVLTLDGLNYKFRDLGAAESSSDLYFTLGKNRSVVFVGDVVFNKMHGFMNDGNSKQWLQVLEQLLVEIGDVQEVFTGHGIPGKTSELVKAQIDYITDYRENISAMMKDQKLLNDEQKGLVQKVMIANYPEYQLVAFIKAGIEAINQELISEI